MLLCYVCVSRTFFLGRHNVDGFGRDDEDGRRELIAQEPELDSAGLVKVLRFVRLAHDNSDGVGIAEEVVSGALVGLPLCDEGREAIVKQLLVYGNLVGHDDCVCVV